MITNDRVEIKDARALWGKDTQQTETELRQELGEKFKVACIGPAGENLVSIAAVINDFGRAAARTGPGAVMGSKKLKAIAVNGSQRPPLADAARLETLRRELIKKIKAHPSCQMLSSQGTPGLFLLRELIGYGIVKNWQMDLSEFPGKERDLRGKVEQGIPLAERSLFPMPHCLRAHYPCDPGGPTGPGERP